MLRVAGVILAPKSCFGWGVGKEQKPTDAESEAKINSIDCQRIYSWSFIEFFHKNISLLLQF
ncbi:MAG: hypothetical protein ABI440_08930, partial [Casimicrobiaceae bacterium]